MKSEIKYMSVDQAVKERIEELCATRKITLNKLCSDSGITQSTIASISSGRNGATIKTIKKICDGLNISLVEFFDCELFANLEQELI